MTTPQWRASHPNAPGVTIPAGGVFQCEYKEKETIATPEGGEAVLQRIVAAYNEGGNPGKFIVRAEGKGRYAVIGSSVKNQDGQDQMVFPILDTRISIPTKWRSADATIELIAKELSAKSGMKVSGPAFADNFLMQSQVMVGGEDVPARTLLLKTLNETGRIATWSLLYDANSRTYALNINYDTPNRARFVWQKRNISN